ncbi:MAG: hypothetical protein LIO37_01590 [Clostridiales bacterium]|nr:hypothetical protein [Clostridiales bacterium]
MHEKYYERLGMARDIVKTILQWAVVSALGFAYWMAMLLLLSIFLLNVWNVKFDDILHIGIVLAVITSIVYAVMLYRRGSHDKKIRDYLNS